VKKTYSAAPPMTIDKNKTYTATVKTNLGDIVIELASIQAPQTVNNFVFLAKDGFYDNVVFHRVVKGFMIQGGDPLTANEVNKARFGTGNPGYSIPDEFSSRKHVRGVISMAHSSLPNSGGSQFFICLDKADFLDGKYAAFGKLIKGEDVLLKIGETPVEVSSNGEMSSPKTRIEIQSVKIVPADSVK